MFRIALRGETWPPERYMTIEANDDDRAGDVEAEPTDEQLRVQKAQAIWSKIAQCLRLQMTKATYDMHFGQAVCSGFNSSDQVLVVSVVSQYAREWIEARLMRVVDRAISEAGYDGMQIHWTA